MTRNRIFDFTDALVRTPAPSVVNGLRAGEQGDPDHRIVLTEHAAYVDALRAAGVAVEVLPPLDDYPDSIFVEDPAFVVPEGAILLRPGTPSRLGESAELAAVLERRFATVKTLDRGYADGGDILILPDEILVGLSARTDREGAERFAELMVGFGRTVRVVAPPAGTLHLKTASSLIDEKAVIATPALADAGLFGDLDVIVTPEGEEAAANLLRVNDVVLVGAGYPKTAALVAARGLRVVPLAVSEIAKIDAGLSCMSLRWRAS
jgi:dimethylargininase